MTDDAVPVRIQVPKLGRARWKLPEQGTIKFGRTRPAVNRKGEAYQKPESIPWFRFCSTDRDALEQLARCSCGHGAGAHLDDADRRNAGPCRCGDCDHFDGGTVEPWKTGFGQDAWQLETRRSRIRVALPANPIDDPQYERFAGGSRDRICDGETCVLPRGSLVRKGTAREEPEEADCLCAAEGALSCKPTTRLRVILPDLDPVMGVWRLDCKGKHAADELPGMAELIVGLQETQQLTHAWLDLAQVSEYGWNARKKARELHHYVTPRLAPAASLTGLLAGDAVARTGLAAGPERLALAAGPVVGSFDPDMSEPERATPEEIEAIDRAHFGDAAVDGIDDDIVDAEIVPADEMTSWDDDRAEEDEAAAKRLRQRIAMQFGDDLRHALAGQISEGRTRSTKELTPEELERLGALARRAAAGEVRVDLQADGVVKVIGRKR